MHDRKACFRYSTCCIWIELPRKLIVEVMQSGICSPFRSHHLVNPQMFASWKQDVGLYSMVTFAILLEVCNSVRPWYCLFLVEILCFLRFWKRNWALAKELREIGYGLEFVTFIRNCFWSSCLSFTWWEPVFRTDFSRECSSLVAWKLYCQRQHGTWRMFRWNAGLYTSEPTYCLVHLAVRLVDVSVCFCQDWVPLLATNVWQCAALRDCITEC